MTPQEIQDAIERRDRYRRRYELRRSPGERLAAFYELQQTAFALLRASPEGYQHFLRRNYASRRTEIVDGRYVPESPDRRTMQSSS